MEIKLEKPRHDRDWLRIYALYLTAFPAAERKPFPIIRKMYRQGRADVWCILRCGVFSGFAATIRGDNLILLDYLAVCGPERGKGVGSAAIALLLARDQDKGLFVEIESTLEEGADRASRGKRKRFYLAAGLEELKVTARVFGVPMELLGRQCTLDFARYRSFYRDFYSPWAAEHIEPM